MIYNSIDDLVQDDLLWHQMALKRTKCKLQADELVHIFYIEYMKLKELEPDKKIERGYVYNALRNLWIKELNYQNRYSNSLYEDDFSNYSVENTEYDFDKEISFLTIELEKVEYFHRVIFKYVVMDGMSMRKLAKQTGIHYNIIQKSIKTTKEYLKNKIQK